MHKFISAVALFTLLVLIGCKPKEDVLKIGLAGVQTGKDGNIGSTMINGSEMAIEEWNAKGGVLGKKIVAVSRDDEGTPDKAVAVAQELVAEGVVAVIGHFNSGCSLPASSIYQQNHLLQLTPASTNPKITEQGFPYLFRNVGRDDQQGPVGAHYAYEKVGARTVAVLHNKTAYGQGLADEFKKTFESLGGKVVSYSGIGEDELDFRANIAGFKQAKADGIFWGGMYNQAGPLVNQLREGGMSTPVFGGEGVIVQDFINTTGKNATNVFLTFGADYKKLPGAQPFLDKYRAKFGPEGPYSVYGYDAVNIVLSAIEEAKTTDPEAVSAVMKRRTFHTSFGDQEFDAKGDLKTAGFVIWTVKDNGFVTVE
jgi:branched-chain amino acid transport system substrate-binding protein